MTPQLAYGILLTYFQKKPLPVMMIGSSHFVKQVLMVLVHLVPSFHGGDDFGGILCPAEGSRIGVGLCQKALYGRLKFDDGAELPRCRRRLVSLAKYPSTAFSQDADVGVKWKVQRGWRASHAFTFGCLCVA